MPFTFSHPAIILPLSLFPRWFSLTGLVAGSMAPDFEYFIAMRLHARFGHTVMGIFWYDLLVGLFIAFAFHNVVRNLLISNLPLPLYRRLYIFNSFNWNKYCKGKWVVVVTSIWIGAASHIFWDAFTHQTGYFVVMYPFLQESVNIGVTIPLYKILQHGSSLIGAFVLGFAVFQIKPSIIAYKGISLKYWLIVCCTAILVFCIRIASGLEFYKLGDVIVSLIAAFLLSLLIAPAFLRSISGKHV